MLEKLMGSPVAWSILSIVAIFSAVFAVYTWIVGKKEKQFSVACKTNEIITKWESSIDKLHVQYGDKPIENLSVSKFYIWNSGNEIINQTDIVISKPLCIKNTGKAEILESQIIRVSEETNLFTITDKTPDRVTLHFDYVDQGEGLVVQILHTGQAIDLELDCKIKAGKEIRDCSSTKESIKKQSEIICMLFLSQCCRLYWALFAIALQFMVLYS